MESSVLIYFFLKELKYKNVTIVSTPNLFPSKFNLLLIILLKSISRAHLSKWFFNICFKKKNNNLNCVQNKEKEKKEKIMFILKNINILTFYLILYLQEDIFFNKSIHFSSKQKEKNYDLFILNWCRRFFFYIIRKKKHFPSQ